MKSKIIHLTSVHPRYDTRIFLKMCKSVVNNMGYISVLVVADGKGDELIDGVQIIDVGNHELSRISRMIKTTNKIFRKAKELNGDIYHLHDPELIPTGLKLKKLGKKVIFDSHEDLPKQLLEKKYLNKFSKIVLSIFFTFYEKFACRKFDAIIGATPFIQQKFLKINNNTINVNNFPILNELASVIDWSKKKNEIVYVGVLSEIRGLNEMVSSLKYTKEDVRMNLGGIFNDKHLENVIKKHNSWFKVRELGFLKRSEVKKVLRDSKVGLVIFYPVQNHINSQPNKMFEYMSAGIPIITSNFKLWREIVEENRCGICVDPLDPEEIGKNINYLINNPVEANKMGIRGREAVKNKYNWSIEEDKLCKLYKELLQ